MIVNKTDLCRAMTQLAKVVDRWSTLPILGCVRMEAVGGTLTLRTTNLHNELSFLVPCSSADLGPVAVEARALLESSKCKAKDKALLTLAVVEDTLHIEEEGKSCSLRTFDVKSFPGPLGGRGREFSSIGSVRVGELSGALSWVGPAICQDEARRHISTVMINGSSAVATNGHCLHRAPLEISGLTREASIRRTAIVALVRAIKGEDASTIVEVRATEAGKTSDGIFMFQTSTWELRTKLVDAQFPPYRQVIPEKSTSRLLVDRVALLDAVKRCAMGDGKGERLTVNGVLKIASDDGDGRTASATVTTLENSHVGEDLEIGFNPDLLLLAISDKRDKNVVLGFNGPLDPLRVDASDRVAVVMPMRL